MVVYWPGSLTTQVGVVIAIAVIMTIGVYGLVAAIVKLDDLGIYLVEIGGERGIRRWLGDRVLAFAPYLMKGLTIVGTAAMFLVGGGILAHGLPGVEHFLDGLTHPLESVSTIGAMLATIANLLLHALLGIIAGGLLVPVVTGGSKLIALFKDKKAS